jgi:hypothetical protein
LRKMPKQENEDLSQLMPPVILHGRETTCVDMGSPAASSRYGGPKAWLS